VDNLSRHSCLFDAEQTAIADLPVRSFEVPANCDLKASGAYGEFLSDDDFKPLTDSLPKKSK
jgi:hypothetical protein